MKQALLIVDFQPSFPVPMDIVEGIRELARKVPSVAPVERHDESVTPFERQIGWKPGPADDSLVAADRIFIKHGYLPPLDAIDYLCDLQVERVLVCGVQADTCVLAAGFALFDAGRRWTARVNLERVCGNTTSAAFCRKLLNLVLADARARKGYNTELCAHLSWRDAGPTLERMGEGADVLIPEKPCDLRNRQIMLAEIGLGHFSPVLVQYRRECQTVGRQLTGKRAVAHAKLSGYLRSGRPAVRQAGRDRHFDS